MSIAEDLKTKHLLCEGLDDDEIEKVAGLLETQTVSKGSPVFRENGTTKGIFMINSGEIEISKKLPVDLKTKMLISMKNIQHCCEIRKTPLGWRQVFANLVDGHFFGELSVIEGRKVHSVDADALDDTELFLLKTDKFHELEAGYPLISIKIKKTIAKVTSKNVRLMDRQLLKILIGY